MFRNKSVSAHSFSMVPRADVPRSSFLVEHAHKTTFDADYLIPVYCEEVLPGDTFNLQMTAFARMSTPIFPLMDNLHLDSFFFFVPNRLTWANWQKFMGEQDNPTDSISYVVPSMFTPNGGHAVNSIYDYFGLPTVGAVLPAGSVQHSVLPLRAYNLIWNEWFRDENLQNSVVEVKTDAGDTVLNYTLLKRGKRADYFTSALPWPQKGGTSVSLPLGGAAMVKSTGSITAWTVNGIQSTTLQTTGVAGAAPTLAAALSAGTLNIGNNAGGNTGLFADLSTATAATINQLRQSFAIQKLLERDARGGTRYAEIVRSHFGVFPPDYRMQRPEYLGGSSSPIVVNPIAQTSGSNATGTTTPLGNLGAMATSLTRPGFYQSFTEHGYVIGLVSVRADLNYQQGLRRHWSRSTRYDYYFPAFAHLGEQAILNKEIYAEGSTADVNVFGYQERWAEYRHHPSLITGLFRSTSAGTLDGWHLSERFTSLPALNATFIQQNTPMARVLAVGSGAGGKQFIFDSVFQNRMARPMPMYSVPGMIDRF